MACDQLWRDTVRQFTKLAAVYCRCKITGNAWALHIVYSKLLLPCTVLRLPPHQLEPAFQVLPLSVTLSLIHVLAFCCRTLVILSSEYIAYKMSSACLQRMLLTGIT